MVGGNLSDPDGHNYTGAENGFPTNPNTDTAYTPADAVTAFRHRTLDFICVVDGGFLQSIEGPLNTDSSPSTIAPRYVPSHNQALRQQCFHAGGHFEFDILRQYRRLAIEDRP
jgi:hypothetical protein